MCEYALPFECMCIHNVRNSKGTHSGTSGGVPGNWCSLVSVILREYFTVHITNSVEGTVRNPKGTRSGTSSGAQGLCSFVDP